MNNCNSDDVIERFINDTEPHPLLLSVRKAGETEKTPLNLDLVTSIVWRYKKAGATVVSYSCTKDDDPNSGIVYIPFDNTGTDIDTAGDFKYTITVTWSANAKTRTIVKSDFILNDNLT